MNTEIIPQERLEEVHSPEATVECRPNNDGGVTLYINPKNAAEGSVVKAFDTSADFKMWMADVADKTLTITDGELIISTPKTTV